jgi:hypothetical protein
MRQFSGRHSDLKWSIPEKTAPGTSIGAALGASSLAAGAARDDAIGCCTNCRRNAGRDWRRDRGGRNHRDMSTRICPRALRVDAQLAQTHVWQEPSVRTVNGEQAPFEEDARAIANRYADAIRCTAAVTQTIASCAALSAPRGG